MDQPTNDQQSQFLSRRDALKAIIAAGGATAFSTLPSQWETPLVKVGALPAFAQTSPAQYPFTNEIEGIEFEGVSPDAVQYAVQPGWIVLAPAGTQVGSAAYDYPWIISKPWLKIKPKFTGPSGPPWAVSIKVKIKIKFKPLPGFGSSNKPVDDTELSCFTLAGADLGAFVYYVTKFKIKKDKIEIKLDLPAFGSFWPFYISCTFLNPIVLLSGASLFPGYYVGPCISGESVSTSFLD